MSRSHRSSAFAVAVLLAGSAGAGEMTTVGNAGNAPDGSGHGAVAGTFRIGACEVTNAEYVEFLNAVAAADPNGLFDDLMTDSDRGGILRAGPAGAFSYSAKANFADKPVNAVDWLDAARYCNWLHHAKPAGAQGPSTTEAGAYDVSAPLDAVARAPGARWFLPTEDEWYKAAYHDPVDPGADAGGTPDYWQYPTRSDTLPATALADAAGDVTNPGPNVANHSGGADWNSENGNVTTVGGAGATSFHGLFDAGGNVYEWTETPGTAGKRIGRGGDFANNGVLMGSNFGPSFTATEEAANFGFRVASLDVWDDLGHALSGTHGPPSLAGDGTLGPGSTVTVTLDDALENSVAWVVLGFVQLDAPTLGGVLVPDPSPPGLALPVPTGPTGTLALSATWPAGVPSGFTFLMQAWIQDPAGPAGFSATNGLQGTAP